MNYFLRLAEFEIAHFRGIGHLKLNELPTGPDAKWIFLTGENGYGKTSLLQALALGIAGFNEAHTLLIQKNEKPEISLNIHNNIFTEYPNEYVTTELKSVVNAAAENIPDVPSNYHHRDPIKLDKVLACYGSSRLEIQNEASTTEIAKNSTTTYGLFHTDGILKNIDYELFEAFIRPNRFEKLKNILIKLIPNLHDITVNMKAERGQRVSYIEKNEAGDLFPGVSFHQLASGARSLIGMVGDIYLRLSHGQTDFIPPDQMGGIVIIDELDLHLHPKWQRRIPRLLSEIFPSVLFIASTHSPIPLLGAPEGSVFLKVNRTTETGITVERLDDKVDISRLLPNAILTSPLFGFEEMIPESHNNGEYIRTEDTYQEMERSMAREEAIDHFLDQDKMEELRKLFDKSS